MKCVPKFLQKWNWTIPHPLHQHTHTYTPLKISAIRQERVEMLNKSISNYHSQWSEDVTITFHSREKNMWKFNKGLLENWRNLRRIFFKDIFFLRTCPNFSAILHLSTISENKWCNQKRAHKVHRKVVSVTALKKKRIQLSPSFESKKITKTKKWHSSESLETLLQQEIFQSNGKTV